MSKGFWIILGVLAAVFVGILVFRGGDDQAGNGAQTTNHTLGQGTSSVTLVEYGDFQCPFCAQYYPVLKQVTDKYGDQITFQFRHLPLPQIHNNAYAAARAAEAAGLQGKFWEMYDLLYQNQSAWSSSNNASAVFEGYAAQLGLDPTKYRDDVASSTVNDSISADMAAFRATGEQTSTPTFFLNGKKITATSVDEFSKFIDEAIAEQQAKNQ